MGRVMTIYLENTREKEEAGMRNVRDISRPIAKPSTELT